MSPLDLAIAEVLRCYPVVHPYDRLSRLGNYGGFSGARLWKVQGTTGSYCVRAWPSGEQTPERLGWIHHLMLRARKAGLEFVPAVTAAEDGRTWVEHAGRLWEVTTWMPGQADLYERPTTARIEAACTALAQLHHAWRDFPSPVGPCPAISRRLEIAREWMGLIQSGWSPSFGAVAADPFHPWSERAWFLLRTGVEAVQHSLGPWTGRILPLQPCLCDIWHDHVLFDGDMVTGLIDYGGVKMDHVAVDLARLLGSIVGDDAQQRAAGLQAYACIRTLSWEEEALVGILEETGAILAVATWLKWLYRDRRVIEDPAAAVQRLSKLVERLEKLCDRPQFISL